MIRRFIYCLAVFALGTASAVPLIVPPKGMQPEPILPMIQQQLAGHDAQMLALYRTSGGHNSLLQVERYPALGMNAGERGIRAIAAMVNASAPSAQPSPSGSPCATKESDCNRVYSVAFSGATFVDSRPVTVCGDRPAWLDKMVMRSGAYSMVMTRVFARSGDLMYEASLNTPDNNDRRDAEASLMTLCPPLPSETPQPSVSPSIITPPQGWIQGVNPPPGDRVKSQYVSRWLKLAPNTHTIERIEVAQKTQSDVRTAEEQTELLQATYRLEKVEDVRGNSVTLCQGRPGWFSSEQGRFTDGHGYIIESMVGNADRTWYGVIYTRRAEEPEDPAARAALDSVCPAS